LLASNKFELELAKYFKIKVEAVAFASYCSFRHKALKYRF